MKLDEWFDTAFCRPAARPLAEALAHTRITPNHVTGLSALVGVLAGICFALDGRMPMIGAILFLGMMVLDCTDGQLARLKGGGTWRGRVLDGLADMVCAFSVHLGMLIHLTRGGLTVGGYTFK